MGIDGAPAVEAGPLAGLREHHGQIVAEATWPPILDRVTWERPQVLFRSRRRGPRRSPSPSLLSGLLVCWRCGANLNASSWEGKPRYFCRPVTARGCAGVTVVLGYADEAVTAMVLARVASPEYAHALAGRSGEGDDVGIVMTLTDRLDGYRARLAALEEEVLESDDVDVMDNVRVRREFRARIADRTSARTGRPGHPHRDAADTRRSHPGVAGHHPR